MNENGRWVTRARAAAILGVHERTINRYMRSGKLDYCRDPATGRVRVHVPAQRVQDGAQVVVVDG